MKRVISFHLIFFGIFFVNILCFGSLKIHFIDVGEGDCILLQIENNKNILIDSGNLSAGYIVKNYLQIKKILRLDCVIITHMHADHVGGIFSILPQIRAGSIYYNGYHPKNNHFFSELVNLTHNLNIPLKTLKAGDKIEIENAKIEVLSPWESLTGDLNTDSIVIKVNFGKISFLLPGDLNIPGEKRLIDAGINLKSDVLKVGHHGADDSSSEEFIDKVRPKIAVLSVGKNNRYGYPSEEVIERLKEKGIPIYRTDIDGNIIIQTDGNILSIKKENK